MRYLSCLSCQHPETAKQAEMAMAFNLAESIGPFTHHHHRIICEGCDAWWFDDHGIGALGIPVPLRRGTVLCGCDESLPQYRRSMVTVMCPEDQCACTKESIDSLPAIRLPL